MFNEGFWVLLAFLGFIGLSFISVKKAILSALDKKIKAVETSILNAEKAKKDSHDALISLKNEYTKSQEQYDIIIKEANISANNILNEAEEKITHLYQRSSEFFEEYKKQSESKMLEELKGDVILTILQMIESEHRTNPAEQTQALEASLANMKKLWN